MYNLEQIERILTNVVYYDGDCSNSQGDVIITNTINQLKNLK